MKLLLGFFLFCALTVREENALSSPRYIVPFSSHRIYFREKTVFNYSLISLNNDLGLLFVGAREAVYALNMTNIANKKAELYWQVSQDQQKLCVLKGKDAETECLNYIRILSPTDDGKMLVCGTNAFSPTCDTMTYTNGKLELEDQKEDGRGKCPFDPNQRFTSLAIGNDLYTGTAINFLGTELVFQRSSASSLLRTESRSSWLNQPTFVHMDILEQSVGNLAGEDDKVYLFFVEKAVEFEHTSEIQISRVARVCKGDIGGLRTLQRKWTSFLKVRLDCPLLEPSLPSLVQDVFLVKDRADWRNSIFYAVFTAQTGSLAVSAVCGYHVADVHQAFESGHYMTPVQVDTEVRWVRYNGEVPVPRPGSCIDQAARDMGVESSRDLPDKTLQFVQERPLMDGSVRPLTGGPLVVSQGAAYSRVVVDVVTDLQGEVHSVMFIGTDKGSVQKAVCYHGDAVIIEEVQLFEDQQPVNVLRLSSAVGQLYAGSSSGVVQMSVSNCSRSLTCTDCILTRDPYCGWHLSTRSCSSIKRLASSHKTVLQSVKTPDTSRCPKVKVHFKVVSHLVNTGNDVFLPCPLSPLSGPQQQTSWYFKSDELLLPSHRRVMQREGLLILGASASDTGRYLCETVEVVKGKTYRQTLAVHDLALSSASHSFSGQQGALVVLSVMLSSLVTWDLLRGPLKGRLWPSRRAIPHTVSSPGIGPLRQESRNYCNNNINVVMKHEADQMASELSLEVNVDQNQAHNKTREGRKHSSSSQSQC